MDFQFWKQRLLHIDANTNMSQKRCVFPGYIYKYNIFSTTKNLPDKSFLMFPWISKYFQTGISTRYIYQIYLPDIPFLIFLSKYEILQTRLRLDKSGRQLAGRELYEFCKYSLYVWQTTCICSWQIFDNIQQKINKYSTNIRQYSIIIQQNTFL